jgi:hypothetical protein
MYDSTRNSHVRLTKARTIAYENSYLQAVLKLKRDGCEDKYTKPRRKEAKSVEYNLEAQKRKKQVNSKNIHATNHEPSHVSDM